MKKIFKISFMIIVLGLVLSFPAWSSDNADTSTNNQLIFAQGTGGGDYDEDCDPDGDGPWWMTQHEGTGGSDYDGCDPDGDGPWWMS